MLAAIAFEDRSTQFICIGPVNKLLNALVWHFARAGESEVARHMETLPLYLSRDEQGVRMNGYNSSQLWDTAFAAQAIAAAGVTEHNRPTLMAAGRFIGAQQVLEESPDAASNDRDPSIGGWPFSNLAHGWPITDCTAEGLKAALSLEGHADQPVSIDRMILARDRILDWQNPDGGWPTYEKVRGGKWLEAFNPSQIFGDIMIDASCVECTSACIQALAMFAATHAEFDHAPLQQAIRRGTRFLLAQQRDDGSWEGSWGVCFTYGSWFGVWGLLAAGRCRRRPHSARV